MPNGPEDVDHNREYIFQYDFPIHDHPGVFRREHDNRPHPEVQFMIDADQLDTVTETVGVRVFDRRTQVRGEFDVIVLAKHDSGQFAYVGDPADEERKKYFDTLDDTCGLIEQTIKSYRERVTEVVAGKLDNTEVNVS